MPRELKDFKGRCLIVGGGWSDASFNPPWRTQADFYTIDIDPKELPDAIIDINIKNIPDEFEKRFDFVFFEYFPELDITDQTFINAKRILSNNGVLLFVGVIPEDEYFKTSLLKLGFKDIKFKDVVGEEDEELPIILTAFTSNDFNLAEFEILCKPAYQYLKHYKVFKPEPYNTNAEEAANDGTKAEIPIPTPDARENPGGKRKSNMLFSESEDELSPSEGEVKTPRYK